MDEEVGTSPGSEQPSTVHPRPLPFEAVLNLFTLVHGYSRQFEKRTGEIPTC